MSKILIVYYSRKGQNYFKGGVKNLEKGNTEIVAEMIQRTAGGDLFEVDTVKPYSEDYRTCVKEAVAESKANARPELKEYLDTVDGYDSVFVGYPNWCGTMPMAMFTFLERYDWSGKKIFPFCTNEGSGMGSSESDIKKICAGASVETGLSVRGCEAAESGTAVAQWVKEAIS